MHIEAIAKKPPTDNQINWVTAFFMVSFHVGAIASLFFFTWKALLVAGFLWWISGSLGIGMGYHRLLTHRVFSDHLCYADARRWADFLGGYSPHSPSVHGPGRRSAFTT